MIFLLILWYAPATQLSLRSYICESNIPLVSYKYTVAYDHDIITQSNSSNDNDGNSYRYADVIGDDCRDRWLYNGNICCTDAVMQVSHVYIDT